MRRLVLVLLLFTFCCTSSASADWRWSPPTKQHRVVVKYTNFKELRKAYRKEKRRHHRRLERYNERRLHAWEHWTNLYIPACTWYGESGTGPEFDPARYTMPNATGSGAYGKYQMMPGTYHNRARYHDWSPLDQEIAGHREYYANGTAPWENC